MSWKAEGSDCQNAFSHKNSNVCHENTRAGALKSSFLAPFDQITCINWQFRSQCQVGGFWFTSLILHQATNDFEQRQKIICHGCCSTQQCHSLCQLMWSLVCKILRVKLQRKVCLQQPKGSHGLVIVHSHKLQPTHKHRAWQTC